MSDPRATLRARVEALPQPTLGLAGTVSRSPVLALIEAAEPREEGLDVERLSRALPRAINFRFLPPRPVNDPIWREIANDLAAALRAIERPAHSESIDVSPATKQRIQDEARRCFP
jgi:hypothetical protein